MFRLLCWVMDMLGNLKSLSLVTGTLVLLVSSGCTMCSNCELDSYSAYGGRWTRTDRDAGRVGSVFDPAGVQVPYAQASYVDSSLAPGPTPAEDAPDADAKNNEGKNEEQVENENAGQIDEAAYYEY